MQCVGQFQLTMLEPLRKIPACQRCRSRKKKCDPKLPACSNCVRANTECMNFDKVLGRTILRRELHNNDVEVAAGAKAPNGESGGPVVPQRADSAKKRRLESPALLSESTPNYTEFSDDSGRYERVSVNTMFAAVLEGTRGVIDLDHDMKEYLVATRGTREVFITNENRAVARLERDILRAYRRNIVHNRATDLAAYDRGILSSVFKRYFTWMNSSYPVLHELEAQTTMQRCWDKEAGDLDQFQGRMVFAIALALFSRPHLANLEIGQVARTFWKAAMPGLAKANAATGSLGELQNVLLVLQYTLLVPESGNLWQLSGTAMRHATGMSLYTEPNPLQRFDALTLDLRRRMFWTCYCVDRTLSTVMGRPSTVPDSWITAQLPSLQEDRLISAAGIAQGPACNLKVAMVLHVGICRLQSEIHARLYGPLLERTKNDHIDHIAWTWNMYDQLRVWRNAYVLPTPLLMREWADFQFHVSVVLLMRPLPHRPVPTHDELHVAFHSAGEAMKLVRLQHRDHLAEFAWLTGQNLFMCGLTYIHALKVLSARTAPRPMCLSFVDVVLQVQACTSMLETLSALNPSGDDNMRNVFELASSATLHDVAKHLPSHRTVAGGCFWEVLARSENARMHRPVEIDGVSVAIQTSATFAQPYSVDDPRLRDFDEAHFYAHDTDAGVPELKRTNRADRDRENGVDRDRNDRTLAERDQMDRGVDERMQVMGRRGLALSELSGLDVRLQLGLVLGLVLEGLLEHGQEGDTFFRSTMAQFSGAASEMGILVYGMDGLAAILTVASEAEPLVALPDYTVPDLTAELDRWFLYPM